MSTVQLVVVTFGLLAVVEMLVISYLLDRMARR